MLSSSQKSNWARQVATVQPLEGGKNEAHGGKGVYGPGRLTGWENLPARGK